MPLRKDHVRSLVHGKLLTSKKVLISRYLYRRGIHVTHIWFRNVQALLYLTANCDLWEKQYFSLLCFSQKNCNGTESFESNIHLNRTFWKKKKSSISFIQKNLYIHLTVRFVHVLRACWHKCELSECLWKIISSPLMLIKALLLLLHRQQTSIQEKTPNLSNLLKKEYKVEVVV